jgi:hypothetical protein
VYGNSDVMAGVEAEELRRINAAVAEVLARPPVVSYVRLQSTETATTLRENAGKTLITDGPFIDSKDFIGGLIIVEADNLDGALAVADDLQMYRLGGGIEVRPVNEAPLVDA